MKNKTRQFLYAVLLLFSSLYAEDERYVIGRMLGGIGNQMFEVATTCALAWDNGAEPYFPDYIPLQANRTFQHIFFRCALNPPDNEILYEYSTPTYGYKPISFKNKMRISGYCQSEKYFAHHRDRLIRFFAPKKRDLHYIRKKYQRILDHPNSVSVHIRYYSAEKPNEPYFRQYDEEYYEQAISLFPHDALFVVISDNINFAKKIISIKERDVIFIEKEPDYIDFFLQILCKHNIIANSTFSWWGAWLNQNPEKIVVRPEKWVGEAVDIGGPDSWIKIRANSFQEKFL